MRNAERKEEMKERGHASREGPAGTRAQLWTTGPRFEPGTGGPEAFNFAKFIGTFSLHF